MTVLVIQLALFRVGQHLVGLGYLLEALLGMRRILLCDVWVVLLRQLAVG